MHVSKMCRIHFTAENHLKFCWNGAWKKIHDDDALGMPRAAVNNIEFELIFWFQFEHHKIYFNSTLFSVSEKETNF